MEWYDYETESTWGGSINDLQEEKHESATNQNEDGKHSNAVHEHSAAPATATINEDYHRLVNRNVQDPQKRLEDGHHQQETLKQDVLDDIFDSLIITTDEPSEVSRTTGPDGSGGGKSEVLPLSSSQDIKNHESSIIATGENTDGKIISEGLLPLQADKKGDISLAEQLENIQNASKPAEDEEKSFSGWFSRKSKSSNNSKKHGGGEKSIAASSYNSATMDNKSNCSKSSFGEEGKLSRAGSVASFIGFGFAVEDIPDDDDEIAINEDITKSMIGGEMLSTKQLPEDEEDDPYGFGKDFNHDEVLQEFHSTPIPSIDGDSHHSSIDDDDDSDDDDNDDVTKKSGDGDATRKSLSSGEDGGDDDEIAPPEHKNQALFDIIEQSFDSIEPFHAAGLKKGLQNTEVKLCFAAYIYVFTPPKPSPLASKFNHDIDGELEREKMANQMAKGEKRSWLFQWKKKNVGAPASDSAKKVKEEEDETYTFEVVPKKIVYALWTEVLRQIDFITSDCSSVDAVLDHIKDSLVQVGLLESSIIDLSGDQEISNQEYITDSKSDDELECEYIAAHHAINGQYGEYLSTWHKKTKQTLERYEENFFAVVSDISNERSISVRDYSLGMLPYTSSRGMILHRANDLLMKESFTHNRMNYFGIIEGTTIHVTDVEFMIYKRQDLYSNDGTDNYDYEGFMKKAYDLVRAFIDESLDCDNNDSSYDHHYIMCDEAGRAFHLMAVSLVAQGLGQEGLKYLTEAARLKELGLKFNGAKESVTLSDTLHCMGLAYNVIGDFKQALSSYGEAMRIRSKLLGDSDLRVAETCHCMGAMLYEIGNYSAAKEVLSEALRIREEKLDDGDEGLSETRQFMGDVLRELKEFDLALECCQASLRTKKIFFGEDHDEVANTMYSLALTFDKMGDFSNSIQYYKEALRIRNLVHGKGLVVADTYFAMGNTYLRLGKDSEAYDHFKESISIREEILLDLAPKERRVSLFTFIADIPSLGAEIVHHYTKLIDCFEAFLPLYKRLHNDAETMTKYLQKMGDFYFELEDYDNAMGRFKAALDAGFVEGVAELRQKISCIHMTKGDFAEAQSVLIKCVTEQKAKLGDDSALLFPTLYNLGVCLHHVGRHDLSLSTFLKALDLIIEIENDHRIGYTHFWIGKEYHAIGDFVRSIGFFEKALLRYRKEKSEMFNEFIIICLHCLGVVYASKGNFQMALKCFKGEIKLLELESKHDVPRGSKYAEANFLAGNVYSQLLAFKDAKACYEKSLASLDKKSNDKVARALEALGTIHAKEGHNDQAKELLIGAYNMYGVSMGSEHGSTVAVAFRLATLLDEMGEHSNALAYYEICLKAKEKKYGNSHEEVATILFHLGKNRFAASQIEDSRIYLEKALAIRKKVLDADHSNNASTFYELAKIYKSQHKSDKAALCYKEALRIWKSSQMFDIAGTISLELASLYDDQKDAVLAVKTYDVCLELLPSHHKSLQHIHFRLGNLHDVLDNPSEAIKHYQECLSIAGSGINKDGKYTWIKRSLARLLAKADQHREALAHYGELIEYMEVSSDRDEDELAIVYHEIGRICFKLGEYDEALHYLKTSVGVRETMSDGKNHNLTGQVLMDLAAVQESIDDLEAASKSLLEALFIFKLKRNERERVSALIGLGEIYEKMDKLDEARECYEDCIEIQKQLARPKDITMATVFVKLGCLLTKMKDEDRSMVLFKAALKIQEVTKNLSDQAFTLQKVSDILIRKASYDEALTTLSQVIRLKSKLKQGADQESAECNRKIGVIYNDREDYKSAIAPLKEAIRLYKNLDVDGNKKSSALHLLGRAYCMTSEHEAARECIIEALALRKAMGVESSADYAHSLTCLGEIDFGEGKMDAAIANLTKALDIYRSCNNYVWSWETLRIQELVGKIFFVRKEYENALRAFDVCLLKCENEFQSEDEMISNIYLMRGKTFAKQGSLDAAYDQFKRCLTVRKRSGKVKESVMEVLIEIGGVLFEQGKYANCLGYYQEGLRLRKILGNGSVAFLQSRIGQAHFMVGNNEEAIRLLEEAKALWSEKKYDHNNDLAHLAYNLGCAYNSAGRKEDALQSYLDAIGSFSLFSERSGEDEVIVASAMHDAGVILGGINEMERAANLFDKALSIRRSQLDKNSTEVADSLYWSARACGDRKDQTELSHMFSEAESIYHLNGKYEEKASCLLCLGSISQGANIDKAMSYYKEAHRLYIEYDLEQGTEYADILYWIGFNMNQKLCFKQSGDILKECLRIRIKEEGKNSLNVGKTCEQLGACLLYLNQYEDALKLYTTSLEIYKDALGGNTAACARIMLDIGTIYSHLQNYDLALVQLNACLEFFEEEHGKESEEVATVLLRIGQVHDLQVDNEEAMNCISRALAIRIKLYTREDTRVAETYLVCGRLLEDWGDVDEAMSCFQNALQIYQVHKDEDKMVATIHDQIAGIYAEKCDYNKAIESYNEALSIYQHQLGERSSEVGHTLRNLGAIYDAQKDYDTSYKYYMDALKILRQVLGDKDLSVALVLNNVGINLARRKKYRKAIDLCTVALRIRKGGLPENHLEIADTLINLANILDDCNKDAQALKFYSEALVIYKANFGDDSEDVANSLKSIGLINIRLDRTEEAIVNFSEALRILRMKLGNDSLPVSEIFYHLGRVHGKQQNFEKSLKCFRESLRIRSEHLDSSHEDVIGTARFVEAIRRKVESDQQYVQDQL